MISNRMRIRTLGLALISGVVTLPLRNGRARQSTPSPGRATPAAATPASGGGSRPVEGRFQLPDNPEAIVIGLVFGNFSLPPEYQYGYEVTIAASGDASVAIYPVGSRDTSAGGTAVDERAVALGEDGLQDLLGELEAIGLFALPLEDSTESPVGGEVDVIEVTLASGQWRVNGWGLPDAGQQERFAAAHKAILRTVGIDERPDLGR